MQLMAYNNRFACVHGSMETVKSLRTLSATPGQLSSAQVVLHQQRGGIGLSRPHDTSSIKLQRAPISPPVVSRGYPYPQDPVRYVPQRYGITTTHYVRDAPNYPHNVSQPPGSPHVRTHDNRIPELTIVRRRPSLLPPVAVSELSPGSVADRNLNYGYRYARIPYKDSESLVHVMPPQHPNPHIHSHPAIDEQIAIKRPRLAVEFKSDPRQPLHVDIRESEIKKEPAYNPQVEAISPTLPSEVTREESPLRSTKDDLLRKISKADREIALAESQIAKLKKKSQELEDAAKKPLVKIEEREEPKEIKHQSLAQKIYAENRRKAQEAHEVLSKLGPKVELPLYNQPPDTSVYHENKRKHSIFKQRLIEYFCQKHAEKDSHEKNLRETYTILMHRWLKIVDAENSQKRKARDAKTREYYEKVFPELRKQREDRERFSRVGARIKSDADLEEIMDGLQEQEMEDKKMRSLTVIPPIMLDQKQRYIKYVNKNGLIEDPMQEYKDRQHLNVWTEAEKELFKEKYLQHPKNFGVIASYLERKSVSDCVQYYYMSKKKENYKQLLRKSRARNRARQMAKPSSNIQEIVSNSTGVTTRGSIAAMQREQQAQAAQKQSGDENATSSSSVVVSTSNSCSTVTTSTTVATSSISTSCVMTTCVLSTLVPAAVDSSQDPCQTGSPTVPIPSGANANSDHVSDEGSSNSNSSCFSSASTKGKEDSKSQASDPKLDKKGEKKKDNQINDSSDEDDDNQNKGGGPHPCVVCKCVLENNSQSRSVLKSQAHQYGLAEDEVDSESRVCSSCRCKSVRRKYTQSSRCPIQTCPTVRWKVKRLRPFPAKWSEINPEMRETIIKEYVIPENTNRCCSACFNRISRKISTLLTIGETPVSIESNEWSLPDIEKLKSTVKSVGMNWNKVAELLGKPSDECKKFYLSNIGKLKIEQDVKEQLNLEGKPFLVDENSGSTTVSCDETEVPETDSSTKPAPDTIVEEIVEKSSQVAGEGEQKASLPLKEDYDSSATVSADEDQSGLLEDQTKNSAPEPTKEPVDFNQMKTLPHNPTEQPPPTQAICLKDVIYETIKRTLKTPSNTMCTRPPPSTSPTLQSILGTDKVGNIIKRDVSPAKLARPEAKPLLAPPSSPPYSVESKHHPPSYDYEVQDLSIKRERKERSPPRKEPVLLRRPPDIHGTEGAKPPPAHSNIQYSRPPDVPQVEHPFYTPRAKSPSVFVPDSRTVMQSPHVLSPSLARSASPQVVPHIRPVPSPIPKQKSVPPPLISSTKPGNEKSSLPPSGSITHGTPVMHSMVPPRFDGILGIANSPSKDTGSITQGLPMHPDLKRSSAMPPPPSKHPEVNTTIMYDPKVEPRPYDRVEHYYKRPQVAAFPSTFGTNGSRPPYVSEPLLSSRQIIMNDYITSQQMHGNKSEKDSRMSPRGGPDTRQEIVKDSRDPSRMIDPRFSLYYPPGSYPNQSGVYISHDNRNPVVRESTPVSTPPVSSPVTMWASTRSPLACQSSSPPQRQGVIQRTAVRPSVTKGLVVQGKSESSDQYGSHHMPKSLSPRQQQFHPDHDAFNAFVNVAAAQPSLAVPKVREDKRNSLVIPDRMRRDTRIDLREGLADSLARSMAVHGDRAKYGDTPLDRMEKISDHRDDMQRYQSSFRRCEPSHRSMDVEKRQHIVVDKMYRNQPFSREQFERELKQDNLKDNQDLRKLNTFHGSISGDRQPSTSKHSQDAPLLMAMKHENRPKTTNTLTAANLFDAIITHQINQGTGEANKNSDALFSKYKKSPESSSSNIEDGKQSPYQRVNAGSQARSPTVKEANPEEVRSEFPRPASGHSSVKSITLGEHIENIITKDLNSSGSSELLSSNPSYSQRILIDGNRSSPFRSMEGLYVETNTHNWKLRKALQPDTRESPRDGVNSMGPDDRQIIRIAQTSPPKLDQKTFKSHTPPNMIVPYSVEPISPPVPTESNSSEACYVKRPHHVPDSTENPRASGHNKPQISPFDYVSSKIAEVMRTSECGQQSDARGSEVDDRSRHTPRSSNFYASQVQPSVSKPPVLPQSSDRCSVSHHLTDLRVPLPIDLHRPYMSEERVVRKLQRIPHPDSNVQEAEENYRKKIRLEDIEGPSNSSGTDSANPCESDSKPNADTPTPQRCKDENAPASSQLDDSPQSGEMVIDETCDNTAVTNSAPHANVVGSTTSYPSGNFAPSSIGGSSSLSSITLNYPYAFSALSVRSMPGVTDVSASATNLAPTVSRSNEPAPLLSSQYEPLSDEE